MDRIEPIRPSPPAIAPADVTRVRGVSRDRDHPDQERSRPQPREDEDGREEPQKRPGQTAVDRYADQPSGDADLDDDGDDDGRPHIDVRV